MIVDEIYRHQPDIIAATTWLFNHEQLLHITARLKALLPNSCFILGGPEFLGNNEDFLHKTLSSTAYSGEREKKHSPNGCLAGTSRKNGTVFRDSAI